MGPWRLTIYFQPVPWVNKGPSLVASRRCYGGWGAQPLVQRPQYCPQSQEPRSPEPHSRGHEPFTLRLDKTKSKPWVLCQLLF